MRRRAKLLTALILVSASATLILWNTGAAAPSPAMGVSDAKWKAHALEGQEVTIRGTIELGSIKESEGRVQEFVVADEFEKLLVRFNQTPPDNFGAKEVMAKGHLVIEDGVPVLIAESIQVGCASKY